MGISAFLLSPESLPVLTAAAAIQESISRFAGTTMMRLARPCGSQVPVPDLAGCAISGPWVDGGDFVESTGSISGDRPQEPCGLGALSRTGPAARQRSRQAMHDGAPKPPFWCPNLLIYFGMCTGAPCEPRIPTWTPVPSWYGFPRIWHTPTRRHGPSPLWSGRQQTGSHHEPDDQHGPSPNAGREPIALGSTHPCIRVASSLAARPPAMPRIGARCLRVARADPVRCCLKFLSVLRFLLEQIPSPEG